MKYMIMIFNDTIIIIYLNDKKKKYHYNTVKL